MKIVSDFRDYYDSGRALDVEDTPLYRRFGTRFRLADGGNAANAFRDAASIWTDVRIPPQPLLGGEGGGDVVVRCVVAFCGRAWPTYIAPAIRCEAPAGVWELPVRCAGSPAALLRIVEEREAWWRERERDGAVEAARFFAVHHALAGRLRGPAPRRRGARRPWQELLDAGSWDAFVAAQDLVVPPGVFLHFRAPILAHYDDSLVVNPSLAALGFQSQMPAQQAWQELSLFLGNTLVEHSQKEPKPITDELRAETHGFDRKESFRKTKAGRKKLDRGEW